MWSLAKMRSLVSIASLAIVLTFVLPVITIQATVLQLLSVEQLAQEANRVVVGRVLQVENRVMNLRGSDRPFRVARIAVESSWKGKTGQEIEVAALGGELHGQIWHVEGAVHLEAQEHVVLFLDALPGVNGLFRVKGMEQGHFRILDAAPGATPLVVQDLRDVVVRDDNGVLKPGVVHRRTLPQFERQVRNALQGVVR